MGVCRFKVAFDTGYFPKILRALGWCICFGMCIGDEISLPIAVVVLSDQRLQPRLYCLFGTFCSKNCVQLGQYAH